jgi:hypothetical protein
MRHHDYDTGLLYLQTLDMPCEEARIKLPPAVEGCSKMRSASISAEARMLGIIHFPEDLSGRSLLR